MINLSKISLGNKSTVVGSIDDEDFKISFSPGSYDKLKDLAKKVENSETLEEWNTYIKQGLDVVKKTPYYVFNSNYLCKIHNDYYIYVDDVYYKLPDPNGKFKGLMIYLENEIISIDKIIVFIARGGNLSQITPQLYKVLNSAGNFLYNSPNCIMATNYFTHNVETNTIEHYTGPTRVFAAKGTLLKKNTKYSLSSIDEIYHDILKILTTRTIIQTECLVIHPDKSFNLPTFFSKIPTDLQVNEDWGKTIKQFIMKHGTKKLFL